MSEIGYRHEYKYVLDNMKTVLMKARAGALFRKDPHARPDGTYSIKSLYFDDINNGCFFDAANGNDPRAKFRIRLYNDDTDMIRLEKKIKQNGFTLKEQTVLSREECEALIQGRLMDVGCTEDDKKKSLLSQMSVNGLIPVIIIAYERQPYIYPGSDIRFTIDTRITFSTDVKSFLDPDKKAMMSLGGGFSVMELKWGRYLPGHITDCLTINSLEKSRFSKYYYCRSMTL